MNKPEDPDRFYRDGRVDTGGATLLAHKEETALYRGPRVPLTVAEWLARDLPEPDFRLGNVFSTTNRGIVIAETGLGKTNFCLALAAHLAAGQPFLHWYGFRPSNVLYIDGEMSNRLMRQRLIEALRRLGCEPDGLHLLCFGDIPDPKPLSTPEGRSIVEAQIEQMGGAAGVDFIVFDSIMALVGGDLRDTESWRNVMPFIHSLTRRKIGQLWVHHTGHDASKGYGDKTREWQMDLVMMLEKFERPGTDVSFTLRFSKARERTPENRDQFADMRVALINDQWTCEPVGVEPETAKRPSPVGAKFLQALTNGLASDHAISFQGRPALAMDVWKAECVTLGLIDKQARPDSARSMFSQYRRELVALNLIACNEDLAWKL